MAGKDSVRWIDFQTLRLFAASLVLSPNIVASCEDFLGARTALSASSDQRTSNTRTTLSPLLWLRHRRAMSVCLAGLPEFRARLFSAMLFDDLEHGCGVGGILQGFPKFSFVQQLGDVG